MWFWKKEIPVTGIDRITKVVESFKEQIADLDQGSTEIDLLVVKNNDKVEVAENKLVRLKERVRTENGELAFSKEVASNLKANISKLLGIDK